MSDDTNTAEVTQIQEARQKVAQAAIDKALQVDLPTYMDKMRAGREPNRPEERGALFGLALLCGHNSTDAENRLRWLEHNWLWRAFHRGQKPQRT